jgi:hypothetical protein
MTWPIGQGFTRAALVPDQIARNWTSAAIRLPNSPAALAKSARTP